MSISPLNSRHNSDDEDFQGETPPQRQSQATSNRIVAPLYTVDNEYAAQLRAPPAPAQRAATLRQRMTAMQARPTPETPPEPLPIPVQIPVQISAPAADIEASVDQIVRSVAEAPRSLAADVDPDSIAPSRPPQRTPQPALGQRVSFSGRSGVSSSYNYSYNSNSSLGGSTTSTTQRTQTQPATMRIQRTPVEKEAVSISQLLDELSVDIGKPENENPLLWFRDDPVASRFTDVWSDCVRARTRAGSAEEALYMTISAVDAILDMLGVQRTELIRRAADSSTQTAIAKFTPDLFLCMVPELYDMALERKVYIEAQTQNKSPEEILGNELTMQRLMRSISSVDVENCQKVRGALAEILGSYSDMLKGPVPGNLLYAVALIQLAPNRPDERNDAWRAITDMAKTPGYISETVLNYLVTFAFLAVDTALAAVEDADQPQQERARQRVEENTAYIQDMIGGILNNAQTLAKTLDDTQALIIDGMGTGRIVGGQPLAAKFATVVKVFVHDVDVKIGNQLLSIPDKLILVMNIIMDMYPDFVMESYVDKEPGSRGVPSISYIPPQPEPRQEELILAPPQEWQPSTQEEQEAAAYEQQIARSQAALDEATKNNLISDYRKDKLEQISVPRWPPGLYLCLTLNNGGVFSARAHMRVGHDCPRYPSGDPDNPAEYTAETRERLTPPLRAYSRLAAVITARLVMLGSDAKAAAARIVFLGDVAVALFFDERITIVTHNEDQLSGKDALWYAIRDIEEVTIDEDTAHAMLDSALSIYSTAYYTAEAAAEADDFVALISIAYREGLGITPGRIASAPHHNHLLELITGALFKTLDSLVPLDLFFADETRNTSERLRLFHGSELMYLLPDGSFGDDPVFVRDITEPDLVPANALLRTPAHTLALINFLRYVHIMLNDVITEGEGAYISAVLENAKTAMQTLKMVEKLNVGLEVIAGRNDYKYENIKRRSPYPDDTTTWLFSMMEAFAAEDAEASSADVARWALMDAYLELSATPLVTATLSPIAKEFFATNTFSRIAARFVMEHTGSTAKTLWPTRVYRIVPGIVDSFPWQDPAQPEEEKEEEEKEEEIKDRFAFGAF